MADPNSSAAVQASQITKLETISLPGMTQGPQSFDLSKYRVRYDKIDVDDAGSKTTLEILETKGLQGVEIVILSKNGFTFMDKYFLIITYLELIPPAERVKSK